MEQNTIKEIKSNFKDEFNYLIDEFFDSFKKELTKHPDTNMPTLTEIEAIWGQLTSDTRDLYSRMIGEAISHLDESEAISSKKANTDERG